MAAAHGGRLLDRALGAVCFFDDQVLAFELAFGHLDRVRVIREGCEYAGDLVSGPCCDCRFHFCSPWLIDVE